MVASDVAKWRSAWWRLGCGGLDLTLILVLDFVLGYFCDIVCWTHVCMLEIFLEFLQGSFLFNYLILIFSFLYAGTYRRIAIHQVDGYSNLEDFEI